MRSDFEPFGWVFEWPFGSESRGKPRRRRSWFGAGDLKYVILEMLAEKPMHGYEVMNALEARTKGCYRPSPGSVYPTLQSLEDEGLVRIEETEGKKVYHVTEAGRAFLVEHRSTVDEIFDRVADTIKRAVREPMPEVSKAVGRVVKQAYRAAWRAEDHAKRVVEILDRAAAELDGQGG
ncbi:MAG: PadR family transcriptional regulator [Gemmatimonadales bacterium]